MVWVTSALQQATKTWRGSQAADSFICFVFPGLWFLTQRGGVRKLVGFPGSEFYQRGGAAKLVALVDLPSAQPRHCGRGKTLPGRREFHDLIKMVNARQERGMPPAFWDRPTAGRKGMWMSAGDGCRSCQTLQINFFFCLSCPRQDSLGGDAFTVITSWGLWGPVAVGWVPERWGGSGETRAASNHQHHCSSLLPPHSLPPPPFPFPPCPVAALIFGCFNFPYECDRQDLEASWWLLVSEGLRSFFLNYHKL